MQKLNYNQSYQKKHAICFKISMLQTDKHQKIKEYQKKQMEFQLQFVNWKQSLEFQKQLQKFI